MKDIDFENELKKISFSLHKNYNGIYLSSNEFEILKKYNFDVYKYSNIKELMFDIENFLIEEDECEDLEDVLMSISEFNYYHNTVK